MSTQTNPFAAAIAVFDELNDSELAALTALHSADLNNALGAAALKRERGRRDQQQKEAEEDLCHKRRSNIKQRRIRPKSLPNPQRLTTSLLLHSKSDNETVFIPPDAPFPVFLARHQLVLSAPLAFPPLHPPAPYEAPTTMLDLLSPRSTPEPYAAQEDVALAAELGNTAAVATIMRHYGRTGIFETSS